MKYDVVIVGGGSAGCTLAARLSEDPGRSVLLLEAGPDYPDFDLLPDEIKFGYNNGASEPDSPFNWDYQATGSARSSQPMDIARGRVIGGSGSVNGQVFLRGLPEDYDSWAEAGNTEWSYVHVLPFFRKLETDMDVRDDFHGSDGPIPVRRVARNEWLPVYEAFHQATLDAGYPYDPDMNNPETTGAGAVPMNNPGNIRMSAALSYLNPVRHRLNLTVRGNVAARRVVFDGTRAVAVEVESGGEAFTVEGGEIVLCAGGLASPQLLLLSGIGPADHLREMGVPVVLDSPGVGKNLRDHPMALVEVEPREGVALSEDVPRIQTGLRYTAAGSALRNDMQITLTSYSGEGGGDPIAGASRTRNGRTLHFTVILELAESAGELTLASANPADGPRIDYRYLEDEFDVRRMREGIRLCASLLEHDQFRSLVSGLAFPTHADLESDESLDAWLHENIGTTFHTCGSARMGPDGDPMAVVDQRCRVRGVEGLRVVDLSVAPNVVRANTNATAIMIAERASVWF
jgi:choline dehydrogenase